MNETPRRRFMNELSNAPTQPAHIKFLTLYQNVFIKLESP